MEYKLSVISYSEDESKEILDFLYEQGYKWQSGVKYNYLGAYSFEVNNEGIITRSSWKNMYNENCITLKELRLCDTPLWEAMNS